MLYLDHLLQLADHQETPAVSLFLPTHAAMAHDQDKNELRKALAQAKICLVEHLSDNEIEDFLDPIVQLFNDASFWKNLRQGLAIYRGPDFLKWVRTPYTLPYRVVVNSHFHLLPLIPYFEQCQRIFVLDLTVNTPTLYEANAFYIQAVKLPHPLPPVTRVEDFEELSKALTPFLQKHNSPLILAGSSEDFSHFLEYCHYPQHAYLPFTAPQGGWRNPKLALQTALQAQLQNILDNIRQYALEELKQQQNTANTLSNMREVANAAYNSRIASLFVQSFPEESETVFTEQNLAVGQELVNQATTHTVLNGGKVYTLPQNTLVSQAPVAAILRY